MIDDELRKMIYKNPEFYMMLGDLDKPFHRPECECEKCEERRKSEGRPTHGELRKGPQ